MKLQLPNITLAIVDCVDFKRAWGVVNHCAQLCDFGALKILTHFEDYCGKCIIPIKQITSIAEYSQFMIRDLNVHIDTEFVLVVQHDGFIVNPNAWDEEFLRYDYIGAPWHEDHLGPNTDPRYRIGNGGFSLRSKKLLDFLAHDSRFENLTKPEDVTIGQIHRGYLEENGFSFPSIELARKFSNENYAWDQSFGQHCHFVLHPCRNQPKSKRQETHVTLP